MSHKLSSDMKDIILDLKSQGYTSGKISETLKKILNFYISPQGIRDFLRRNKESKARKSMPSKFRDIHKQCMNLWLSQNKDLTARDLQLKFLEEFHQTFALSTIKGYRRQLNWTAKRKRYCQLISHKNKLARVEWCLGKLKTKDSFQDVIFVDESNVELSSTGRLSFYQTGSALEKVPSRTAKPKHSYTVHVWAGISYRGRTNICIFTGIMDSIIYQKILEDNLLPFVREKFPDGYRLYQDNDSKHKSKSTRQWMEECGLADHVMETPASSPDINAIENVWSTMKDFLQRRIKPKTKDQLVEGIRTYWETLTTEQCGKFIDHIHKVLPVVVLNNGGSTDY